MDYEQKYKEILAWARKNKARLNGVPIEDVLPELAESEDERIRKEIIKFIEDFSNPCDEECNKWIAYLEKQKEQKSVLYSPLCNTIKDKIREYVANNFVTDTIVKTDVKSIVKAMEEGVRLGKEEQKPAEWNEKFIADVFEKVGLAKIVREQGNDALTNAVQSAMIELSKVENTEWSEEDERMLSRCVKSIESSKQFADSDTFKKAKDNEIDWLENRFKFLRPQPKVEWSEEDEKRVKQLIYDTEAIRAGYEKRKESLGDDFNDELIKDCDEQINWLKSIRPHWKPSEDDIKMLEHIIGQYEIGNKNSKVMGYLPKIEELNFLKKVLAKWKNLL